MCDSILATPQYTGGNAMLFGKNSDRQRNEAQIVEHVAASRHQVGSKLPCTYISVPQVEKTHAVILCRPFWMWGAEMGANEHGVVIGNEALQAKCAPPEEPALTGMDIVRLALERATSAQEAVDVITALLREFGQGGNCGHLTPNYYNNGFLIADATQAFVLETIGREWLLERIDTVKGMSNVYSIGSKPEETSSGLGELIRDWGQTENAELSYADVIKNPHREHIVRAEARATRSSTLLGSIPEIRVEDMKRILRDHGYADSCDENPADYEDVTLCMHAGANDRPGQTVGSLVSELHGDHAVHWVTATPATCLSIFKPLLFGSPMPEFGGSPTDKFDSRTLWWLHEQLHRTAIFSDFGAVLRQIKVERDALEASFRERIREVVTDGSDVDRGRAIQRCWADARAVEERWLKELCINSADKSESFVAAWGDMNERASFPAVSF